MLIDRLYNYMVVATMLFRLDMKILEKRARVLKLSPPLYVSISSTPRYISQPFSRQLTTSLSLSSDLLYVSSYLLISISLPSSPRMRLLPTTTPFQEPQLLGWARLGDLCSSWD